MNNKAIELLLIELKYNYTINNKVTYIKYKKLITDHIVNNRINQLVLNNNLSLILVKGKNYKQYELQQQTTIYLLY